MEKYSFGKTTLLVVLLRQHLNRTNVAHCNSPAESHNMSPAAPLLKATFSYSGNMVSVAHTTFKLKLFNTNELVLRTSARLREMCLRWQFGNVYDFVFHRDNVLVLRNVHTSSNDENKSCLQLHVVSSVSYVCLRKLRYVFGPCCVPVILAL